MTDTIDYKGERIGADEAGRRCRELITRSAELDRSAVAVSIQAGSLLIAVKAGLPHGQFAKWQGRFGIHATKASRLMRLASEAIGSDGAVDTDALAAARDRAVEEGRIGCGHPLASKPVAEWSRHEAEVVLGIRAVADTTESGVQIVPSRHNFGTRSGKPQSGTTGSGVQIVPSRHNFGSGSGETPPETCMPSGHTGSGGGDRATGRTPDDERRSLLYQARSRLMAKGIIPPPAHMAEKLAAYEALVLEEAGLAEPVGPSVKEPEAAGEAARGSATDPVSEMAADMATGLSPEPEAETRPQAGRLRLAGAHGDQTTIEEHVRSQAIEIAQELAAIADMGHDAVLDLSSRLRRLADSLEQLPAATGSASGTAAV